ncbi:GspH/FimT family pseudopilin (plasmid) [Parasalinivibrio latis]|uniref:pilus assembly FimT family protein n=1 Tax=Parasalinivibrio latis TaxID=2952610 RepID=UPI0030E0A924
MDTKKNGFTLMELLISVVVISILASAAAPSFLSFHERLKMDRFTQEFSGFFTLAKSEAIMKMNPVYVHLVSIPKTGTASDTWCIIATDSATIPACSDQALTTIAGKNHSGLTLTRLADTKVFVLDPVWGRAEQTDGTRIVGMDLLTYTQTGTKTAKAMIKALGKLRFCSDGGEFGMVGC